MASIESMPRDGDMILWRDTAVPIERAIYAAVMDKVQLQVPCCKDFLGGFNLTSQIVDNSYTILCWSCGRALTKITRAELVSLNAEAGAVQFARAPAAAARAEEDRMLSQGFLISSGAPYDQLLRMIVEAKPGREPCCAESLSSIRGCLEAPPDDNYYTLLCGFCGREALRAPPADVLKAVAGYTGTRAVVAYLSDKLNLQLTSAELIEAAILADLLPLQSALLKGGQRALCCEAWDIQPRQVIRLQRSGTEWAVYCKACGARVYTYQEERLEPLVVAELKRRTGWRPEESQVIKPSPLEADSSTLRQWKDLPAGMPQQRFMRERMQQPYPTEQLLSNYGPVSDGVRQGDGCWLVVQNSRIEGRFNTEAEAQQVYKQLLYLRETYGGLEEVWSGEAQVQTVTAFKRVILEDYTRYRMAKPCCASPRLEVEFEGSAASVVCAACKTIGAVYSPDAIEYATEKATRRKGASAGRFTSSPNAQRLPASKPEPKIAGLDADEDRFANLELPSEFKKS